MLYLTVAHWLLVAGVAVCHAARLDEEEFEEAVAPILPPPGGLGLLAKSNKGPSIAQSFGNGMVKDYVTVIRKKPVVVKEKVAKLQSPLDTAGIGLQVSLLINRNKYLLAKLRANGNDWYKATVALVANLCADTTEPEEVDGCNTILHELAHTGKEARGTFWEVKIMPLQFNLLPFVEQERKDKKSNPSAEFALALIDMHKTHSGAIQAREAYNNMLDSIEAGKKLWRLLVSEMEQGLSNPALQRAFLAQCRVVPSILGIEESAHPLDCLERVDDIVHHLKFKLANCLVLGGPKVWDGQTPPLAKKNKTLDLHHITESDCDHIVGQPWDKASLEPTQDLLACSAVVTDKDDVPVPITRPHLALPSTDEGRNHLQNVFRSDDALKAAFVWESTEKNDLLNREQEVVGAWRTLSEAISDITGACNEPSVSTAKDGENLERATAEVVKEACKVTTKAVERLAEQATAALETSTEYLGSSDAHLFMAAKDEAKTKFLKLLQNLRADEVLFEEIRKEKEEAKKTTSETKKPGPGGMLLPPPGLLTNPKAKERDFTPAPRVPVQEIDVWELVDRVVKLWRVLFDASRRAAKYTTGGASFLSATIGNPLMSRKCTMLAVCTDLPNQLRALDSEIKKKKAGAKKKRTELKSFCQKQNLCLPVTTYWQDCTKSSECPTPDPKTLGASTEVLWCEKSMKGMVDGMEYAAAEKGIQLSDSCDVTVHILDEGATTVVGKFTSSDVQKKWTQPFSAVATYQCQHSSS